MTLFKDPKIWAESAVGTKLRFFFFVGFHVFFVLVLLAGLRMQGWLFIVVVAGVFPVSYLYALRRLLLLLQNATESNGMSSRGQ